MAVTAPQPAVAPPQLVGPTSASLTQFEREVTSERIRDKIAASKRKGIWVGGNLPLGYQMQDGKIAIVEEEAELVRPIYRRYLELGSVNELLRDLKERNVRTKSRLLSTGVTRGGIPFGRGALYYVLSNHFYVGEVKYKGEILPGEQPPIMDRTLFDAVRQKSLARWFRRTTLSQQGRPPFDGAAVRRRRISHDSDPRHKSRRPLPLLRVDTSSAWRGQDRVNRIDLPHSRR
jgi:hypothetical protein